MARLTTSMKIGRGCLGLVVVGALALWGWFHFTPFNRFPSQALKALADDPNSVLYSIEPLLLSDSEAATVASFHGYQIVGQFVLADRESREF